VTGWFRSFGIAAVALAPACTPAPVAAFEDFYAATVRKDGPRVRALLCGEARAAIADVDDATLLSTFAVGRVLRHVQLVQGPAGADGAVDVVVEDALGSSMVVSLRPEGAAPGRWCIVGIAAPTTPSSPGGRAP
jgi:hypothetical protein